MAQPEPVLSIEDERAPAILRAVAKSSIEAATRAAAKCRACDLWKNATQTVFGEGADRATVVFVGEQPGDKEDLAGHPFVGPAGKLLDEALLEAGVDRRKVYITNAVNGSPPPVAIGEFIKNREPLKLPPAVPGLKPN